MLQEEYLVNILKISTFHFLFLILPSSQNIEFIIFMYPKNQKKMCNQPGSGRWDIPDSSKPRGMAELGERGRSMLYQGGQIKESWESHCGKELKGPQTHHQISYKYFSL